MKRWGGAVTSVIFVHGTGVRGDAYRENFARVRSALRERAPGVKVLPCQWGDALGATLGAGGSSVPRHPAEEPGATGDRAVAPDPGRIAERDWASAQWALLEADPLHELRLRAVLARDGTPRVGPFVTAAPQPGPLGPRLAEGLRRLPEHPLLLEEMDQLGLRGDFAAAVPAVLNTSAAQEALHTGTAPELAPPFARAVLAEALRRSAVDGGGPAPVVSSRRELLLRMMVEVLGGAELGLLRTAGGSLVRLAWRWAGASAVERRRAAIVDSTYPMAGDILLYLSRGHRIREYIAACCEQAEPPVVLMGHSLGGVAALDVLAGANVPGVEHLVTVGSQASFLYEIGALPSLAFGEQLPPAVPAWTNFYDPRDLLAYVGEPVFPGRVTDVCVPSGNPFTAAHSDYFGNPDLYDALAGLLP